MKVVFMQELGSQPFLGLRDAYNEGQDDNSNTSDTAFYDKDGRLEMDFYAGFANEIGETGLRI